MVVFLVLLCRCAECGEGAGGDSFLSYEIIANNECEARSDC